MSERTPASEAERAREIEARHAASLKTGIEGYRAALWFTANAFADIRWLLADRATMAARIEALEARLVVFEIDPTTGCVGAARAALSAPAEEAT